MRTEEGPKKQHKIKQHTSQKTRPVMEERPRYHLTKTRARVEESTEMQHPNKWNTSQKT